MADFLFLVAKDNFNLKNDKKIDLKKLSVLLKNNEHFKVSGDPSISIDTFQVLQIKNEYCFFSISYKGFIQYLKITSFDFFLNASEFKKSFFENYVKECLIIAPKSTYKSKASVV